MNLLAILLRIPNISLSSYVVCKSLEGVFICRQKRLSTKGFVMEANAKRISEKLAYLCQMLILGIAPMLLLGYIRHAAWAQSASSWFGLGALKAPLMAIIAVAIAVGGSVCLVGLLILLLSWLFPEQMAAALDTPKRRRPWFWGAPTPLLAVVGCTLLLVIGPINSWGWMLLLVAVAIETVWFRIGLEMLPKTA
jgi:hypothetical protein